MIRSISLGGLAPAILAQADASDPPAWFWLSLVYIIGLGLFFVELFIPSGGLVALTATFCVVYALYFIYQQSVILAVACFLLAVLYLVLVIRFGLGRLSHRSSLADHSASGEDVKAAESLIGRSGVAESWLRPAGIARIDGKRFDVVTTGSFVEKGTPVEVVRVDGNRIIVRGRVKSETRPSQ